MSRKKIKLEEPVPQKRQKKQDNQTPAAATSDQVGHALQKQELTPDVVRSIQSTHGNQFVSRMVGEKSIQLGRGKKDGAKDGGSSDLVVVLPDDVIRDIQDDTLMSPDEQYEFQGKLAAACGIPSKSHRPHGSNFSKQQTTTQVVNNFLSGISITLPPAKYKSVVTQFSTLTGVTFG